MIQRFLSGLTWIAIVGAALLAGCSRSPVASGDGGGMETTNGVVASIRTADGLPAKGATVYLRRSDYLSRVPAFGKSTISGADAITDSSGRFVITGIDSGAYRIEVAVAGSSVLLSCTLGTGGRMDLGVRTLEPCATAKGSVAPSDVGGGHRYVQIYGLERVVEVSGAGGYVIGDLPAGLFRLRVVSGDASVVAVTIDSVRTTAGTVTDVPLAGWKFSKRVVINTTTGGANIREDVTGVALPLRLDGSAIDFSQTRDSGQDLRFVNPDGSPLPFRIREWDRASRRALVWVRMDTVRRNDSSQYFSMQYGNAAPSPSVSGPPVFDTAQGVVLAWHLDDKLTGDSLVAIVDESGNNHKGTTRGGMTPANAVDGVAGGAIRFDGIDDHILRDRIRPGTGDFSLGIWVNTSGTAKQSIVTFMQRDSTDYTQLFLGTDASGRACFGAYETGAGIWHACTAGVVINNGQWHHLGVSCTRLGLATLYVDGAVSGSVDISALASTDLWGTVWMGCTELNVFAGMLDEARISGFAGSAARMRLEYEIQRSDQSVIRFR